MENYTIFGNGGLEKFHKIVFVATRPDGRYVPMTRGKFIKMMEKELFPFFLVTDDGTVLTKEQIDNFPPNLYSLLEDYQKEDFKLKSKAL